MCLRHIDDKHHANGSCPIIQTRSIFLCPSASTAEREDHIFPYGLVLSDCHYLSVGADIIRPHNYPVGVVVLDDPKKLAVQMTTLPSGWRLTPPLAQGRQEDRQRTVGADVIRPHNYPVGVVVLDDPSKDRGSNDNPSVRLAPDASPCTGEARGPPTNRRGGQCPSAIPRVDFL